MQNIKQLLACLFVFFSLLLYGCAGDSGSTGPAGPQGPAGGTVGTIGTGNVVINGESAGDPQESIYVRKIGNGSKTIVLIPGNNTSGLTFEPMLDYFRSVESLNTTYTVYTFDYRGSGNSSYNKEITSLATFAADFEKVMNTIPNFPTSGVTLVGYSLGHGVALEMIIANPGRYSNLIGIAPIGTRGVRVGFNAYSAGADPNGNVWQVNDWITVSNDAVGLTATEFQQRAWQGTNRTYNGVKAVWDMVVYNDVLKYNINTFTYTDPTGFATSANYSNSLMDGLKVQYMPESLYYAHKFNVSSTDTSNTNANGTVVRIAGDGRLATKMTGKRALLVKAVTDFAAWRGDQVIYDNYIATSKFDLKRAGATTTAIMINANQGFDHGFPVAKPYETIKLIDSFIKGTLTDAASASAVLGSTVTYYDNAETTFETNNFTGF